MKLGVRLNNKTVFTTTFSVAQTGRSTIPKKSYAKRIRFSFKQDQSIVWSGYRDENILSPAKQRIKCEIWMAGASESAIIFGVSFDKRGAIFMNTLHLASPTSEARSEIAEDLLVVTSPITDKKPNYSIQRMKCNDGWRRVSDVEPSAAQ